MKTLKNILEGVVTSSDYKLDKKGRKYPAHRRVMEDNNPYDSLFIDEARKQPDAMKDGKLQGHMVIFKPKGNLNGDEVVNKVKDIAKSLQSNHPDKVHKGAYSHGYGEYSFNDKHRGPKTGFVVVKSKEHLDAVKKHIKAHGATIQEDIFADLENEIQKNKTSKVEPKQTTAKTTKLKDMNPLDREQWEKEKKMVGIKEGTMRDGKYVDDAPRPGTNEVPVPDEGYRPPKSKVKNLIKKPETKVVDDGETNEETEVEKTKRQSFIAGMAKKSLPKNSNILKTRTGGSLEQNVEVYEGRGRPKKETEDDEGEQYDADSGVEADQHIHVQLKKAADSDQKPYEVSFKNGKKHTVSQHVAKNLLSATEKLKPEHRKTVHDEIHKSYDNLLAVHKMVAGK